MEQFPNSVATKRFVDGERWGILSCDAGDDSADIAVEGAGLDCPVLGRVHFWEVGGRAGVRYLLRWPV